MNHQPYPEQLVATNWFHVLSTVRWAPKQWSGSYTFTRSELDANLDEFYRRLAVKTGLAPPAMVKNLRPPTPNV